MGLHYSTYTIARQTFLLHCFCVPTQEAKRALYCLQNQVLLIRSALYTLLLSHPLATQFHFPQKLSHGLSTLSDQSLSSGTHTTHYHHLTFAHAVLSHPQQPFLPRPLPCQSVLFGGIIVSGHEHRLRLSVAKWPWTSVNFMGPGLLIHKVVTVKVSVPQKVILRTKSKTLGIVPSTQYMWVNIIFQKSF